MRCSSCEPLLDRYVEGTLPARDMRRMRDHLATCASCESLLLELRVVDALLATTQSAELAPNFTFAVMAEVRSMPASAKKRALSAWSVLTLYVVSAWILATAALFSFGSRVSLIAGPLARVKDSAGGSLHAITAAMHAFAPAAPYAVAFVALVVAADLALIGAIVLYYRTIRPHLLARFAAAETL